MRKYFLFLAISALLTHTSMLLSEEALDNIKRSYGTKSKLFRHHIASPSSKHTVIYINGICTTSPTKGKEFCKSFQEKHGDKDIGFYQVFVKGNYLTDVFHVLKMKTQSRVKELNKIETDRCIACLENGGDNAVTILSAIVQHECERKRVVTILAYSGGAAVVNCICSYVPAHLRKSFVRVYTFGGASFVPDGAFKETKNFMNKNDLIPYWAKLCNQLRFWSKKEYTVHKLPSAKLSEAHEFNEAPYGRCAIDQFEY